MAEEKDIWNKEIEVRESKGLLDPEVEYTWELYKRLYRKDIIFSGDAPEEVRGKALIELNEGKREEVNPNWCTDGIELHFRTVGEGENVELKTSQLLWRDKNGDFTLSNDENKPEYCRVTTYVEKVKGNKLTDGDKMRLGDSIIEGTQFLAHAMSQRDRNGKETGFSELDLNTIRDVKMGDKKKEQSKVAKADVTDEQRAEIKALMSTMKNPAKDDVMKELISSGKPHLMGAFIAMDVAGEFKWK